MFAKLLTFHVERTMRIEAPPERVFAFVNDFRRWSAWSPFESADRAASRTFDGAPDGNGAVYAWSGPRHAGVRRARRIDATSNRMVTVELDFETPLASRDTSEFRLESAGGGTAVTWSMHGAHPFIGSVLESGLASLKAVAEG